MPDFVTRDGQIIRNATDEAIAALRTLERIADEQAAAAKMFGAPRSGPSAIERHAAIRQAQHEAQLAGRKYEVPAAPQATTPQIEVAKMTVAERWALMRSTDQSTMKPYQRPS